MSIEPGHAYCGLCVKRPTEQGGNGSCPVVEPLRSQRQRFPNDPHACPSFVLGDRKPLAADVEQDSLFDVAADAGPLNGAYGEGR